MQHFKFKNWSIGQLENSIFNVTNRLQIFIFCSHILQQKIGGIAITFKYRLKKNQTNQTNLQIFFFLNQTAFLNDGYIGRQVEGRGLLSAKKKKSKTPRYGRACLPAWGWLFSHLFSLMVAIAAIFHVQQRHRKLNCEQPGCYCVQCLVALEQKPPKLNP